jgi:cell division septation protein DedD
MAPGAARPAASAAANDEHWVQLGAFRTRSGAERLLIVLRKNSAQDYVFENKYSSKEPLYLVRVSGLVDRTEVSKVTEQAAAVLRTTDTLIGESPRASGLHPRPPPR